jgi:hypothetical protein
VAGAQAAPAVPATTEPMLPATTVTAPQPGTFQPVEDNPATVEPLPAGQ